MADILALVLTCNCAQPRDNNNRKLTPISPRNALPCMIVGESCNIKTSLLFLTAVTAASDLGVRVVFFTPTPFQSLPGLLQDSLACLNPESLKKITFMYSRSQEELLQNVAYLHESVRQAAVLPALLIVDRLDRYLGLQREEQAAAAVHLSALLIDTASFLTRNSEEPCRVIVSFDVEQQGQAPRELAAPDPILSILNRYFSVHCTLDRDRRSGVPSPPGEPGDAWQIYFSGAGNTVAHGGSNQGDQILGRQWQLAICPNGTMEFLPTSMESCVNE
ncbi:ATPase SWSAP1 [Megalops cyprinoides]|uniref:ATPase SWSAP1 n=1 Tax=Megalops cyprinoides TaxID=118141 RepID=UPI0018641AA6|nr:ATPase SWSAP1 [Megalops cyprinoides]